MEGYLEKKSSKLFRAYQRRWFFRKGDGLFYRDNKEDGENKVVLSMRDCLDVRLRNEGIRILGLLF